eukprot:14858195-Alexandrium_andersonii.AAC.1
MPPIHSRQAGGTGRRDAAGESEQEKRSSRRRGLEVMHVALHLGRRVRSARGSFGQHAANFPKALLEIGDLR